MSEINEKNARECRYRTPECDIFEDENAFYVLLDVAGVTDDDLNVVFENDEISISGKISDKECDGYKIGHREYTPCNYRRTFSVPEHINADAIEARLKDGELKLTLPKSDAVKPRKIEITTS